MEKPRLSFWQIWNMSFGFLGIQFGFALQNANVSRIFETLGADKDQIPILWLAAPVTGLLVQPIIGYLSDRTWHPRWGRRRPFFMIGAILASLALIVMPNSPALWIAAATLWIMDASINISMEPFRAFVGDMLPSEQRTSGFAVQSFFIGIGAVIASVLPWVFTNWLGVANTAPEGQIPPSVQWSFYIGAFAFFAAVMWTVFSTQEYPPDDMEAFLKEKEEASFMDGVRETVMGLFRMPKTMQQLAVVQFFSWFALFSMWIYSTSGVTSHIYDMKLDAAQVTALTEAAATLEARGITEAEAKTFADVQAELQALQAELSGGAGTAVISTKLFSFFLNDTRRDAVAPAVAERLTYIQRQYNDGADWVGILMGVYNGIAALVAFLLPIIARVTSRKMTHTICLVLGGLGLASFYFFGNPMLLIVSMIGVGFAWASILTMPYAMLAGALPPNKMGYYMGVFNFFIVIPQITAAGILGWFLRTFADNEPIYALLFGGASMVLAGLLTVLIVKDVDDVAAQTPAEQTEKDKLRTYYQQK